MKTVLGSILPFVLVAVLISGCSLIPKKLTPMEPVPETHELLQEHHAVIMSDTATRFFRDLETFEARELFIKARERECEVKGEVAFGRKVRCYMSVTVQPSMICYGACNRRLYTPSSPPLPLPESMPTYILPPSPPTSTAALPEGGAFFYKRKRPRRRESDTDLGEAATRERIYASAEMG